MFNCRHVFFKNLFPSQELLAYFSFDVQYHEYDKIQSEEHFTSARKGQQFTSQISGMLTLGPKLK